jgi:CheY-like chemotaxis protein
MVGNLLTNAGRFTDAGGRVEVRTVPGPDGASAIVSVTDTGVGIAPELLARLFDPFSQADQDLARTKGGLGLGLALTKGLAELHGGQVIAESEGPGRGATFRLLLPRARGPQAPTGAEAAPRDGAGLRVLIVEDNRDAAETLRMVLELQGHEVKVAFDGAGGIAAARAFAPEVVISDIGLPGELDGYAVARALRAEPGLRSVRLIALSGYVSEEARRKSREAGFDAHLGKPPDLETLEALLSLSKEGA